MVDGSVVTRAAAAAIAGAAAGFIIGRSLASVVGYVQKSSCKASDAPSDQPTITAVDEVQSGLSVTFSDGHRSLFPWVWLRDASLASEHRLSSGQRLFETHRLPTSRELRAQVADLQWSGEALSIDWRAGEKAATSTYTSAYLRHNCSVKARYDGQTTLWANGEDLFDALPHVDAADVLAGGQSLLPLLRSLKRYGVALITGASSEPGTILEIASALGFTRETNYGVTFDVLAAKDQTKISNLAVSAGGLSLHTDNPYRDPVPGVQLLHCVQPATGGGGATVVADGYALGEDLRVSQPKVFERLTRGPPRMFQFVDTTPGREGSGAAAACLRASKRAFELDPISGAIETVAYNNRSMLPPVVKSLDEDPRGHEAEADLFAWSAVGKALEEQTHRHAKRVLQKGELLVMINTRVYHGRDGFEGHRHLQGCYIDCDQLWSTLAVLEAAEAKEEEELFSGSDCVEVAVARVDAALAAARAVTTPPTQTKRRLFEN